jgi:hypothetical protein
VTEEQLSNAQFWFAVVQAVWSIAVTVYVWLSNRQRATKDAIDRVEAKHDADLKIVEARLQEHGDRLLQLEQRILHLPNNDKIGQVHYRIDQLGQGVEGMKGELKQINHTLHLIQSFMMGGKE